jgi:hypothetical protein
MDDSFQNFGYQKKQGNRSVVIYIMIITFLMNRNNVGCLSFLRNFATWKCPVEEPCMLNMGVICLNILSTIYRVRVRDQVR